MDAYMAASINWGPSAQAPLFGVCIGAPDFWEAPISYTRRHIYGDRYVAFSLCMFTSALYVYIDFYVYIEIRVYKCICI